MIKKPNRLAYLIGSDIIELNYIIDNIDRYYSERKELKVDVNGKPKIKNGNQQYRTINPSKGRLKEIQLLIKTNILSNFTFPFNIQGSVKGKDNISNAKIHQGKKFHLCTDLSNFFPTVTSNLVFKTFRLLTFSNDVSRLLTQLTTYKYKLPQGTPTSPCIANLVFSPYDKELIKICEKNNIFYSRYVDDLTFSSPSDFKDLIDELLEVIHKSPFKINHKKTSYKLGSAKVTGIITKNNVLDAREDQKDKLKNNSLSEKQKIGLKSYIERVKNS